MPLHIGLWKLGHPDILRQNDDIKQLLLLNYNKFENDRRRRHKTQTSVVMHRRYIMLFQDYFQV